MDVLDVPAVQLKMNCLRNNYYYVYFGGRSVNILGAIFTSEMQMSIHALRSAAPPQGSNLNIIYKNCF